MYFDIKWMSLNCKSKKESILGAPLFVAIGNFPVSVIFL